MATGRRRRVFRMRAKTTSMLHSPLPKKAFRPGKQRRYVPFQDHAQAADMLRERFDHVSKVMTQEQGKVYVESRAEVSPAPI